MSEFWLEIWERHIRRKESPARLLRVTLEKIDREAADNQYLRIKADGRFFFAHALLLRDTSDLPRLRPGQELFVGAHRLGDGCFWLHWLRTASGLELAPGDDEALAARKENAVAVGKTLLVIGCAALAALLFAALSAPKAGREAAPLAGMACLALAGYGWHRIRHASGFLRAIGGEKWRILMAGLKRARENDVVGFVPLSAEEAPALPLPDAPPEFRRDMDLVGGTIASISSSKGEGQSVHADNVALGGAVFDMYEIVCEGRTINFPGFPITRQTFANLHPSMLDKRFLFLAPGDRITAVINAHEGLLRKIAKITPSAYAEEAVALINHVDGHVAVSMAVQLTDPRHVQLALGLVCGLLFACVLAMTGCQALIGETRAFPTFPIFGFFGLGVVWAGLCLLWELGKNGVLLLTGTASERRLWEDRISALIGRLAPGRLHRTPAETWARAAKRTALLVAIGAVSTLLVHVAILADKAVR